MIALRPAALLACLLGVVGCGVDGETCGRGRCTGGATCISIFGAGRQNQGWRDQRTPQVDGEWWCQRACPAGRACAGGCLQDPADDEVIVCAVAEATLQYHSAGSSCLCPAGGGLCPGGLSVQSIDVLDGCAADSAVIASCLKGVDCPVGPLLAGDAVPGVRLHGVEPNYSYTHCPGRPENRLGAVLPEGAEIRVWVDVEVCR